MSKNCNFTEVGEPFAEQPLAIAVQQGSHLAKIISTKILELQKDRYFEQLTCKFLRKLSPICYGFTLAKKRSFGDLKHELSKGR